MWTQTTRIGVLVALPLLGGACGDEPSNNKKNDNEEDTAVEQVDSDTTTTPAGIDAFECAVSPHIPTSLNCTWASDEAGAGFVEAVLDSDPTVVFRTPDGPDATDHDMSMLGLLPGRTWNVTVGVSTADGEIRATEPMVFEVDLPPTNLLPMLDVVVPPTKDAAMGTGFLLTSVINLDVRDSVVVIVNGDGQYVWWYRAEAPKPALGLRINTAKLSADGDSVLFSTMDIDSDHDVNEIYRVSLDGRSVSVTRAPNLHHDFQIVGDKGAIDFLDFEIREYDSGVVWASDRVVRVDEGTSTGKSPDVRFSWLDDYLDGAEPMQTEFLQTGFVLGAEQADYEFSHTNSLMELNGDYYLLSKYLDVILKVPMDPAEPWEMGGAASTFTMSKGGEWWSHAHMSHFWDGGLAVFDNGYRRQDTGTNHSRAVEYAYDESDMTITQVWTYDSTNDDDPFTTLMGDVRKLEGGTYLIGWSDLSYVSEVAPTGPDSGDEVWRVDLPVIPGQAQTPMMNRVQYVPDLYDPIK